MRKLVLSEAAAMKLIAIATRLPIDASYQFLYEFIHTFPQYKSEALYAFKKQWKRELIVTEDQES
jgi:hypothetical protein